MNRLKELLQLPGFNLTNPSWDKTDDSFIVSRDTSCETLTQRLVLSHFSKDFDSLFLSQCLLSLLDCSYKISGVSQDNIE